jgi:tetratricopeptide (TPR) repeat protein
LNLIAQQPEIRCGYCGSVSSAESAEARLVETKNANSSGTFLLAEIARSGGNVGEALGYYNKVIEGDAKCAEAWLGKGLCMLPGALAEMNILGDEGAASVMAQALTPCVYAIQLAHNQNAMRRRVIREWCEYVREGIGLMEAFAKSANQYKEFLDSESGQATIRGLLDEGLVRALYSLDRHVAAISHYDLVLAAARKEEPGSELVIRTAIDFARSAITSLTDVATDDEEIQTSAVHRTRLKSELERYLVPLRQIDSLAARNLEEELREDQAKLARRERIEKAKGASAKRVAKFGVVVLICGCGGSLITMLAIGGVIGVIQDQNRDYRVVTLALSFCVAGPLLLWLAWRLIKVDGIKSIRIQHDEHGKFALVLKRVPPEIKTLAIHSCQIVRPGLTLKEAKQFVENAPQVLLRSDDRERLEAAVFQLGVSGIEVEIELARSDSKRRLLTSPYERSTEVVKVTDANDGGSRAGLGQARMERAAGPGGGSQIAQKTVISLPKPPGSATVVPRAPVQFHVALAGQASGPFSEPSLKDMTVAGTLTASSMVWRPGMAGWQAAGSVTELAGLFGHLGAPPTPPPLPNQS